MLKRQPKQEAGAFYSVGREFGVRGSSQGLKPINEEIECLAYPLVVFAEGQRPMRSRGLIFLLFLGVKDSLDKPANGQRVGTAREKAVCGFGDEFIALLGEDGNDLRKSLGSLFETEYGLCFACHFVCLFRFLNLRIWNRLLLPNAATLQFLLPIAATFSRALIEGGSTSRANRLRTR
ncbi:MAG: hypothetical protein WA817_23830 [Candidatus Acidiferrum sp.]